MPKLLPMPQKAQPAMTLLEYVCERLLGEPIQTFGNGEAYWYCPWCCSSRFHTRPSHSQHEQKWSCWSCGEWGDEFDLLKWAYPDEDYGQRQHRLTFLQMDFERLTGVRLGPNGKAPAFSSGEVRPTLDKAWAEQLVAESAERVWRPHETLEWGTSGGLEWRQVPEHPVLAWLRQRGLTDATIKVARLGTLVDGELVIPWCDSQGGIRAVNLRRFDDVCRRYHLLRGSRKGVAYPDHRVDGRPVLLCEGELDTLLVRQELGDRVQAVTFGGAADRPPQELLAVLAKADVIVAYDADQAGDANHERLRAVLPQARRMRPSHGKDVTETHAAVGLRRWFDQSLPVPVQEPPSALSDRQIELMLLLARTRGPLTRADIADRCNPETAKARTLRPMIDRGLLREEAINSDGVVLRLISLTPAGRAVAEAIRRTRLRQEGSP